MTGKSGRRWADFLEAIGFEESEHARGYVESASYTPGRIVEVSAVDGDAGKVYSYRKYMRSTTLHPELKHSKKIDEMLWPHSADNAGVLPGVTLILSRTELTNAFAISLGDAIRQDYGGRFALQGPSLNLSGCNIQYVLVESKHPRRSKWPSRVTPEAATMLRDALDIGIRYIALHDENTIVGLDLGQSRATSEERWTYLQKLCAVV